MLRALPLIVAAGYHMMKAPTCPSRSPIFMSEGPADARVDVAKVATAPELSGRGATADPIGWTHTGHTVPRTARSRQRYWRTHRLGRASL